MSRGGDLTRFYGEFTGEERFRLVLEAKARGDSVEEDRLIESCPAFSVTMNDPAFVRRWLAAEELVKALVADTSRFIGWMQALDFLRSPVTELLDDVLALERAYDRHDGDVLDSDAEDDFLPDDRRGAEIDPGPSGDEGEADETTERAYPLLAMQAAHNVAAGMVAARWEAFTTCCREDLGVEAETLLRAMWPEIWHQMEALGPAMAGLSERSRERVTEERDGWRAMAGEVWRTGIGAP